MDTHKHLLPKNNFRSKSMLSGENHVPLGYDQTNPPSYDFCLNANSSWEDENSEKNPSSQNVSSHSQQLADDDGSMSEGLFDECLALEATEKSLYDALNNVNSDHFTTTCESLIGREKINELCSDNSREKKNRHCEPIDLTGQDNIVRGHKQISSSFKEHELLELYDDLLLCSISDRKLQLLECDKQEPTEAKKKPSIPKESRRKGKKKVAKKEASVDLTGLLLQCAKSVSSFDIKAAKNLLFRIREHSNRHGNGTERLAYYFTNAIEAHLAGTGKYLCSALDSRSFSAADGLKAYEMFLTACPFEKMSNLYSTVSIGKLAIGATNLHIIDFGILYGLHWPCLIKTLSERPGGPPRLRITGIDFPHLGLRPAERFEITGRRLARYCERFGVPFEYKAITKKWETVRVKDLEIRKKEELVVVNCLYMLHNVADETLCIASPRDAVLRLTRAIEPAMFVHGVAYGTYNTPFFFPRFKEALYHFSSIFDMFEARVGREDENRLLWEELVYGRELMNVIGCEGIERVERPETHRQWRSRTVRAGFRQLQLDREIIKYVRGKVRRDYCKEFSVDEEGEWMLQGWKGRVTHAMSCWEPATN